MKQHANEKIRVNDQFRFLTFASGNVSKLEAISGEVIHSGKEYY